ncbi:glucokinase [Vibrio tritonius]|uniref:glucokinase n=1 Tax=Vibrio tritonius TaxID=1435069 RepID=UPI00315CBA44
MPIQYALVGDIGGTNARLALCDLNTGQLVNALTYSGAEYPSLEVVIKQYLNDVDQVVQTACLAIACPINGDWICMTNHSWAFSIKELKEQLHLEHLEVINDFTAVSMAIPVISTQDRIQLGGTNAQADKPIAIFGAGTGLGVAHLIQVNNTWITLPGEGGHVDFAPCTPEEDSLLKWLRKQFGRVSAERCLSGQGLVQIYHHHVISDGREPSVLEPKDITTLALENGNPDCVAALKLFCILMGRFAGNLALNMGTFGGVYIAGGIAPRFKDFLAASDFSQAFEDKGRFNEYLQDIPVYLITHQEPGLLGAGSYLRQALGLPLNG